jgi:WD40 repeat protein
MTEIDGALIAPARADLETALGVAVATVNGRARERLLGWPPDDLRSFRKEIAGTPEGYRQWVGGDGPTRRSPYGRAGLVRSALAVAWWSDHVGRRHVRLLGRRATLGLPELVRLMWPEARRQGASVPPVPPLALVYRHFTFLRAQGGRRRVVALCRCGVSGEPGAVGWMGDCCGPCHDRRQSGEGGAPAAAGAYTFRPEGRVGALTFAADGNTLLVGAGEQILFWDVAGGRERFALPCGFPVWRIAVAADGSAPAASGHYRAAAWRGLPDAPRSPDWTPAGLTSPVALAPGGSLLAASGGGSLGMQVFRWPARPAGGREGALEASGYWQGDYVSELEFGPDGRTLAASVYVGGREGGPPWGVRLWDAAAGRPLPRVLPVGRRITRVAFAADGRALAVGTGASTAGRLAPPDEVEVWDVASGARQVVLGPHTGTVSGVGPLPGGRRLLSADHVGRAVRLWNVAAGREEAAFEWHQALLSDFALSPDGRWLATGDNARHVRLWPVAALCAP